MFLCKDLKYVHVCKSCVCVDMLLSLQGTFKKKTPDASVALNKYTFMDAKNEGSHYSAANRGDV